MNIGYTILFVFCIGIVTPKNADEEISIEKVAEEKGILSGNKPLLLFGDKEKDKEKPFGELNDCEDKSVGRAFRRYDIVPDIVSEPPHSYVYVNYEQEKPCLGNNIDICGVVNAPSLEWNCQSDKLYTIFFVDLYPVGIKNPELLSQGILWWVVDVPGCNLNQGSTLFQYQQPLPLYGSGSDHYVFLIYEQPSYQIDWSEEPLVSATSEKYRYYRCVDKLANKYQLKLIAGNFYTSEFKPCVEEGFNKLDSPSPQYVDKGAEAAHLPTDPYATSARKFGN